MTYTSLHFGNSKCSFQHEKKIIQRQKNDPHALFPFDLAYLVPRPIKKYHCLPIWLFWSNVSMKYAIPIIIKLLEISSGMIPDREMQQKLQQRPKSPFSIYLLYIEEQNLKSLQGRLT